MPAALAVLSRAAELHPGDHYVHHALGLALCGRGENQAGLRHLGIAAALRPESAGIQVNLGVCLAELGKLDEAEACYRRAISREPAFALPLLNLGIVLLRKGQMAEAEAYFLRCLKAAPGDPTALAHLGRMALESGDIGRAEAILSLAACRGDNHLALYHLGLVRECQGRHEEALSLHRLASDLSPERSLDYRVDQVRALQALARHAEADTLADSLIRLAPARFDLLQRLATGLHGHRRDELSLRCDRLLLTRWPHHPAALRRLCGRLLRLGRADQADRACEAALAHGPSHLASLWLGVALRSMGESSRAIALLEGAVRSRPSAFSLTEYAKGLLDAGRRGEAARAMREAMAADQSDAFPDEMGGTAERAGEPALAERAYRRAIELSPDHPEALCNLGLLLARTGRLDEGEPLLARGHAAGSRRPRWPYPSARWLAEVRCARLISPRLSAIISGELRPALPRERILWGRAAALYLKNPGLGARLVGEAMDADPTLCSRPGMAARRMVLEFAAADGGLEMRLRALAWLCREVAQCRAAGKAGREPLAWLLSAEELTRLREGPALLLIPPEERAVWRRAWADARYHLDRMAR
jgi:Flp pilus assembly protein TadD